MYLLFNSGEEAKGPLCNIRSFSESLGQLSHLDVRAEILHATTKDFAYEYRVEFWRPLINECISRQYPLEMFSLNEYRAIRNYFFHLSVEFFASVACHSERVHD